MCDNRASYWVASGFSHKEITVPCGRTDPYGGVAICDKCADDKDAMAAIQARERLIEEDNAASHSAGWGDW